MTVWVLRCFWKCAKHVKTHLSYHTKFSVSLFSTDMCPGWDWLERRGHKMINKVTSTFQVGVRAQCLANCTVSPTCDSYNYRPSDKTCQLNTHDTRHTGSGLVLVTRRASSTHTILRSLPTQAMWSATAPGPGANRASATSSKQTSDELDTDNQLHLVIVIALMTLLCRVER